jgi:hypothetical protein
MQGPSSKIEAVKIPIEGMAYFIARPRLWLFPLFGAFLSLVLLIIIFTGITVVAWPEGVVGWQFTWQLFKAFGYATVGSLILWAILFPFVLALFFEGMLRRILRESAEQTKRFVGLSASMQIVFRTLVIRIFWPVVGLISTLFFGPVGMLIGQIGIGHLAMIDACDLTLALKGASFQERMTFYREKRWEMLLAGMVGGAMSLFLGPTLVGWIFWIPGLYVGALLWIQGMRR